MTDMRRLTAALMLLAVCAGSAHAQLYLGSETQNRAPLLSSRQMTLTPMVYDQNTGVQSGVTLTNAETNSALLASYAADGWQATRLSPQLAGYGFLMQTGVTIDKEGFRLNGNGLCDTRAESDFAGRGGNATRLVMANPYQPYQLYIRGAGAVIDGINFYGDWETSFVEALKQDVANHAPLCILQGCQYNGIGSGKVHFPSGVVFSCFHTAIQLGDDPLGDNADQYQIASLRTPDCVEGIHAICQQAVTHEIGQYEGVRVGTMFYFERGGQLLCHQPTIEVGVDVMLRTRTGSDDASKFTFGTLTVDGSVGSHQVKLIQEDAFLPNGPDGIPGNSDDEGQQGGARYTINDLQVCGPVTQPPLVELRGYSKLLIHGGSGGYDRFIRLWGGYGTNYYKTILIENHTFRVGKTPSNCIDEAGSGDFKARVVLRNNDTVGGSPFPDETFFITKHNGVVTRTPYDPNEPDASRPPRLRPEHWLQRAEFCEALAA